MNSSQRLSVFLCCLIAGAAAKPPTSRYSGGEDVGYQREDGEHPMVDYEDRELQNLRLGPSEEPKQIGSAILTGVATSAIVSILGPLFSNLSTGLLNGFTATANNRTLDYIPIPAVPLSPPSRPYQQYPGTNQL